MAICNCPVYEFGVCLRATHVSESRLGCATGWRRAGTKDAGGRWDLGPRAAYYLAAGWSTASDGRTKALEAIIVNRDTGPRGLSDNQLEAILVNAALGVRIFPHGPTTKRPESNAARVKRAGKWGIPTWPRKCSDRRASQTRAIGRWSHPVSAPSIPSCIRQCVRGQMPDRQNPMSASRRSSAVWPTRM